MGSVFQVVLMLNKNCKPMYIMCYVISKSTNLSIQLSSRDARTSQLLNTSVH